MLQRMTVLGELIDEFSESDKIAVDDGINLFTFSELHRRSNALAADLAQLGVKKGDRVVVAGYKTALIVPVTLAIWKLGAIYVPIDINLPEERLKKIFQNIDPVMVIAPEGKTFRSVGEKIECPTLNVTYDELQKCPGTPFASPVVASDDIAVLIHTSGSTGLPKAVMLEHGAVISYFIGHIEVFNITDKSRCFSTASVHFDVSLQDIFMPLTKGAYVYVNKEMFFPQVTLSILESKRITHLTAVVTILKLITGDHENLNKVSLRSLKSISTGAEVCDPALMHAWMKAVPGLLMVNGYGPTEANSCSLSYVIPNIDERRREYYPIGRPHRGVSAILIGQDGAAIDKPGAMGELLLAGPQLMKGYWKNESETNRVFVTVMGQRYYRTGDLCIRDDKGNFVYQGRKDAEIKIAGKRVNLLEVAHVVSEGHGVSFAHVISLSDQSLAAICSLQGNLGFVGFRNLTKFLGSRLPAYMLPRRFGFYLGEVCGSTGKTDVRLLTEKFSAACIDNDHRCFVFDASAEEFRPLHFTEELGFNR